MHAVQMCIRCTNSIALLFKPTTSTSSLCKICYPYPITSSFSPITHKSFFMEVHLWRWPSKHVGRFSNKHLLIYLYILKVIQILLEVIFIKRDKKWWHQWAGEPLWAILILVCPWTESFDCYDKILCGWGKGWQRKYSIYGSFCFSRTNCSDSTEAFPARSFKSFTSSVCM